jgi:hypothetical protein
MCCSWKGATQNLKHKQRNVSCGAHRVHVCGWHGLHAHFANTLFLHEHGRHTHTRTHTDATHICDTCSRHAPLLRGSTKNMPRERAHGKQCARIHVADGADRWQMARKRTHPHTVGTLTVNYSSWRHGAASQPRLAQPTSARRWLVPCNHGFAVL